MKLLLPSVFLLVCCAGFVFPDASADVNSVHAVLPSLSKSDSYLLLRRRKSTYQEDTTTLGEPAANRSFLRPMIGYIPVIRRYLRDMESCGLLSDNVVQMIRIFDVILQFVYGSGYLGGGQYY